MRKFIIIAFLLLVLGIILGYRFYNKPHRSVAREEAISTGAVELFEAFEINENDANQAYLDKVLAVTGMVSDVLSNQDSATVLVLKTNDPLFGISCTMADPVVNVRPGMNVTIKGICTGYLSDVVITNGILVE